MAIINTIADTIYMNGNIYTADVNNTFCQAIAIADGYIIATGTFDSLQTYIAPSTTVIDLQGKTMIPGIVDAHLHPFWGGLQLSSCQLNYESLTIKQSLDRIQCYLESDVAKGADDWLQVRAWLRQGMLPPGTDITRFDLDTLTSERPIILFSNDCHTLVANSRALALFKLDEHTPEPSDGKICRAPNGKLNGILEDAPAMRAFDSIPTIDAEQAVLVAESVQQLLNEQGVTTVMDARALDIQFQAFSRLNHEHRLTIRLLGAKEITPDDAPTVESIPSAIAGVIAFKQKYSDTHWQPKPGIAITLVKFFVDGVLQAPIMTASLLEPYLENTHDETNTDWVPSCRYGDRYYSESQLNALVLEASRAGFHPHMHTVADGAIEMALNAIELMREALPEKDIRPGLAHNELAAPHHYARFAKTNTTAVLSFQWAGMTTALINELTLMLGQARYNELEPSGKFIDSGARVAFGSDWPIDPLNEWYDFKVAMTRRASHNDVQRLNSDRNMTITEVLRAATIDAAYALDKEHTIGSIEVGKFADLAILDRNPFAITPEAIEHTIVLETLVGGKVVFRR